MGHGPDDDPQHRPSDPDPRLEQLRREAEAKALAERLRQDRDRGGG
jgi:hypothetical protein